MEERELATEYENANGQYMQLTEENRERINLFVAELLRAQQSQHQ